MSAEDKLTNPVRQRMQAGGVSLGMPVRLGRSGDIARIARSTGHDFIFIDCQHSLFNLETIGHLASTAMACGVAPLVRVRGVDAPDVSLLLDNGAMGIVYPDINTAAEARRAVASSSRPSRTSDFWRRRRRRGRRGFATGWPDGSLRHAATKSRKSRLHFSRVCECTVRSNARRTTCPSS
jgi:2-keto-3-deoxy-L-rhamnonate aldolase RhmA